MEFLEAAQVTQSHIAQAVGYHKSTVSLILAGRRGSSALFADRFITYCGYLAVENQIPLEAVPTLRDICQLAPVRVADSPGPPEEGEILDSLAAGPVSV